MIIVMKPHSHRSDIDGIIALVNECSYEAYLVKYGNTSIICVPNSNVPTELINELETQSGISQVIPIPTSYKLTSRAFQPENTVIQIGTIAIGAPEMVVIAGPCAVESRDQLLATARLLQAAGAHILRGGAFKPRTSPYSFQGLGEEGLRILAQAREETGLPVITEVMNTEQIDLVARYADILQIGSRNMQNFALLRAVGESGHPVMIKRGFSSTIEEWLLAAEYVLSCGNRNVILCERGIRNFDTMLRNVLDISAVPLLAELTHLPVIVDPSHATGKRSLVEPLSLAAAAAGAAGIMVEVHPTPDRALCDGTQSIDPAQFARLVPPLLQISRFARAARVPMK